MVSMLERNLRQPSASLRDSLEQRFAMGEHRPAVLPGATSDDHDPGASDEMVAALGACLAVLRSTSVAELARAVKVTPGEVQQALRLLSAALAPLGMRVLEDGTRVELQAAHGVAHYASVLAPPRVLAELTELQMGILMMAVYRGGFTVDEVSDLRQTNSWSVVHALETKGYLRQDSDSFTYRPTLLVLHRFGAETFDELVAAACAGVPRELLDRLPVERPEPPRETAAALG